MGLHRDQTRSAKLNSFAEDVLRGLQSIPKKLDCKYLYDARGSEIFSQITTLDEYYLTRAENEILAASAYNIALMFRDEFDIVELGAGDGSKVVPLLKAARDLGQVCSYCPVDISISALQRSVHVISEELPDQDILPLHHDYFRGLESLSRNEKPTLILFLGSTIGNLDRNEQIDFVRAIRDRMKPMDKLLIGFDLKKDTEVMWKAYNDSSGLTAEFNLNLIDRINRELGGDFDRQSFFHHEPYNPVSGAMESFLISRHKQAVWIEAIGQHIVFEEFEPIHIESSYKFTRDEVVAIAHQAGFDIERNYYDKEARFMDSVWQVRGTTWQH